MSYPELFLAIVLLVFALVGGMVDTYASHRFFPPRRKPPPWFSDYFLVWWLVVFVVLLPFMLVYIASGFSFWVIKVYVVFGVLASVIWDLIFSKIWSGQWISDSCLTWFWVDKHTLGFNRNAILWFHLVRVLFFVVLFYLIYIHT